MTRQAYVDTSCLVALALGEPRASALRRRLGTFAALFSSNLLEAELRSVFRREAAGDPAGWLGVIAWILPDRPLSPEIARVLESGYVRGADCWHLATALYLAGDEPAALTFMTLDERQRGAARALGFQV